MGLDLCNILDKLTSQEKLCIQGSWTIGEGQYRKRYCRFLGGGIPDGVRRFLDDYLLGNVYFRTEYPEHNLVRTRCQLNMARDVMKKMGEMERIIKKCVQG